MNRLDFLRRLGLGIAAVVATPNIITAISEEKKDPNLTIFSDDKSYRPLILSGDKKSMGFCITSKDCIGANPTKVFLFNNKYGQPTMSNNGGGEGTISLEYYCHPEINDRYRFQRMVVSSNQLEKISSIDFVTTYADGGTATRPIFINNSRSPMDFNPDTVAIDMGFILDDYTQLAVVIYPGQTINFSAMPNETGDNK